MRPGESDPPLAGEGGGSEAEEAAWEIATAEMFRARGDLAEAANWYRRAAQHLMEAGEDERAIEVAKLAAELAALDDAGRPAQMRVLSVVASAPEPRVPRDAPTASPEDPPAVLQRERLPWEVDDPSTHKPAPPLPRVSSADVAGRALPSAAARARSVAATPAASAVPGARPAKPEGLAKPAGAALAAHSPQSAVPPPTPSPLAAMVDEAVARIEELPPMPLSEEAEQARSPRPPLSFRPERVAEADRIFARLPALPLFSDLPSERLREVSRQVGLVRFAPGELLCEVGGPEGPMFVLVEGSARVTIADEDAATVELGVGDFVGEISAMYGGARTATVRALAEVDAVAFAPSLVRALAREFPTFREALEDSVRERVLASLPRVAPLLRRVEGPARVELFRRFELVTVREGALLLSEGEPTEAMYLVGAGEVEIYGGEIGPTRPRYVHVGEAFGLRAMATGEPSGVSARASRDVLVARLGRAQFQRAMMDFPALAAALEDVDAPGRGVVC